MGDWEKLLAGEPYNDFSRELFDIRVQAKRLFKAYNRTGDDEVEERARLMRELFGQVGERVWIEPDFHCEFGKNITLGDDVYLNFNCTILDCAPVSIGAGTFVGPNVGFYAVNHALDAEARCQGVCQGAPIRVGSRCWLGGSVTVLAGVQIGDDCVIGAGSVVTKNIPSKSVAVGNPCRVIRTLE